MHYNVTSACKCCLPWLPCLPRRLQSLVSRCHLWSAPSYAPPLRLPLSAAKLLFRFPILNHRVLTSLSTDCPSIGSTKTLPLAGTSPPPFPVMPTNFPKQHSGLLLFESQGDCLAPLPPPFPVIDPTDLYLGKAQGSYSQATLPRSIFYSPVFAAAANFARFIRAM